MPASSLIFIVIVAIWAAVLVQVFARRRQNAAEARSAEMLSDDARVLQRPSAASSEAAHRSAPTAATTRSPLVARRASEHVQPEPVGHLVAPEHAAPRVSLTQRRIRAGVLLAALLWVPTSVTLTVIGRIHWVAIPLAFLTVVAVLFWLRVEAQADRARARGQEPSRRAAFRAPAVPALTSDDTQVIRHPDLIAAVDAQVDQTVMGRTASDPAPETRATHAAGRPSHATPHVPVTAHEAHQTPVHEQPVFDLSQVEEEPAPPAPVVQPTDGTWHPVPVPPPTYAMKAKADLRYTDTGIPADVFDTPEFADEADELDDRAIFARRAASQ